MKIGVIATFTKACEHAHAGVSDDDLQDPWRRRIGDEARLGLAAMTKHVLLKLAHGADDSSGDKLRKAGCDRGLLGADRPQRPQVGTVAFGGVATQGKHASARF